MTRPTSRPSRPTSRSSRPSRFRRVFGRVLRPRRLVAVVGAMFVVLAPLGVPVASADGPYQLIEGTGSTWSQNALNQWIADVSANGIQVAYGGGGASKGRRDFGEGTVDFAVTEIPFQGRDPRTGQSDTANGGGFA